MKMKEYQYTVRYGKSDIAVSIFFLLMCLIFAVGLFAPVFTDGKYYLSSIVVGILFSAFSVLGVFLTMYTVNTRFRYEENGFEYRNSLRKKIYCPYDEITQLQISTNCWIVYTKGNKKISVPILDGTDEMIGFICSKVNDGKIRKAYNEYINESNEWE
ncbi:MAG: hypothetical protein Q4E74_09810 [Ruminococcus sp.]|nr:hypothetical protein [Ruminococcus sp.]